MQCVIRMKENLDCETKKNDSAQLSTFSSSLTKSLGKIKKHPFECFPKKHFTRLNDKNQNVDLQKHKNDQIQNIEGKTKLLLSQKSWSPIFFKILELPHLFQTIIQPAIQKYYFIKKQKQFIFGIPMDDHSPQKKFFGSMRQVYYMISKQNENHHLFPCSRQVVFLYLIKKILDDKLRVVLGEFRYLFNQKNFNFLNLVKKFGLKFEKINEHVFLMKGQNSSEHIEQEQLLNSIFSQNSYPLDSLIQNILSREVKSLIINRQGLKKFWKSKDLKIKKEYHQFLDELLINANVKWFFNFQTNNLVATFHNVEHFKSFLYYLQNLGQKGQKWKKLIAPDNQNYETIDITLYQLELLITCLKQIQRNSNQQIEVDFSNSKISSVINTCQQFESRILDGTKALRKPDLNSFNLIWTKIKSFLKQYIIHNEVLSFKFKQKLSAFLLLLDFKIRCHDHQNFSIFSELFPQCVNICQRLKRVLSLPKSKFFELDKNVHQSIKKKLQYMEKNLDIETPIIHLCLDFLLDSYYAQASNKLQIKKRIQVYLSKQPLNKQLNYSKYKFFCQRSSFRSSFEIISQKCNKIYHSKKIKITSSKIEKMRMVVLKCLGCSPFFYQKMNISDGSIQQTPLKIFSNIKFMRDYERQIKNDLCAMLNSGGGIIIFSCHQQNEKVQVFGLKMSEKAKEQYEQRFMSYVDAFEPKTQAKRSVAISFVPVKNLPKNQSDEGTYIEGTFAMRVRVNSVNSTLVYYYKESNDANINQKYQRFTISFMQKGEVKQVKPKYLVKQMKKKMKFLYLPERLKPEERLLTYRDISVFNHECLPPESGICLANVDKEVKEVQREKLFLTAVLVVVKRQNQEMVEKLFKRLNINVKIEQKYQQYNFKPAQHTAILYTNEKFEKISNAVKENPNQFVFNKKSLLVINITYYLRYSFKDQKAYFEKSLFLSLRKQLQKILPHEKVKAFKFRPRENTNEEYYLKFESYEASLFGYYYMNHNMKERVIFKNPLHLDKMESGEKSDRLEEICREEESEKMY